MYYYLQMISDYSPARLALRHQGGTHAAQLIVAAGYARTGQLIVGELQIVERILERIGASVAIAKTLIKRAVKREKFREGYRK